MTVTKKAKVKKPAFLWGLFDKQGTLVHFETGRTKARDAKNFIKSELELSAPTKFRVVKIK